MSLLVTLASPAWKVRVFSIILPFFRVSSEKDDVLFVVPEMFGLIKNVITEKFTTITRTTILSVHCCRL